MTYIFRPPSIPKPAVEVAEPPTPVQPAPPLPPDPYLAALRAQRDALAARVTKGDRFLTDLAARVGQDAPEYERYFAVWAGLDDEYRQVEGAIAARSWRSVTVRFPANAPIATIAGGWRRLPSGEIEASYTRDEMQLCMSLSSQHCEAEVSE